MTAHNRVPAVPQLNCVGGSAKGIYEIDVLRCKNVGSSYDDENVQWTCTASLPSEFKLGSTDVICEGLSSANDPYVLKGSCGVEYRLTLTDLGEEKYGSNADKLWHGYTGNKAGNFVALIFWLLFFAAVGFMIYAALIRDNRQRRPGGHDSRFGGGGGNNDDPPPPYDYHPSPKPKASSSTAAPRATLAQAQQGWRPGFWTGALSGAAAGYMTGTRSQNRQPRDPSIWRSTRNNVGGNGEGSSDFGRTRSPGNSSNLSSSYGSSTHDSSGFGSTSRR